MGNLRLATRFAWMETWALGSDMFSDPLSRNCHSRAFSLPGSEIFVRGGVPQVTSPSQSCAWAWRPPPAARGDGCSVNPTGPPFALPVGGFGAHYQKGG